MIIKENRKNLSQSEVVKMFDSKILPEFKMTNNTVNLKFLEEELANIKRVSLPFSSEILTLIDQKKIVLVKSDNKGSSLSYLFGTNSTGDIKYVYVNIAKYLKSRQFVDSNGDLVTGETFTEDYVALYDILFSAYVAMNCDKAMQSTAFVTAAREAWINIMANVTSIAFGNPVDGQKFRFIMSIHFYNGQFQLKDIATTVGYNVELAQVLQEKYPDLVNKDGISFTRILEVLANELPGITIKGDVTMNKFVMQAITGVGANGIYLIDNIPYLLAIIAIQSRKSKIRMFSGYMLQNITQKSNVFITELKKSLM